MIHQPEIIGSEWLNTPQPLTPEEMNGRVILVDFFTYSCANCLRTIPHLRQWWERYKNLHFLIIGVHTPEFDFEKDRVKVATALKDLHVDWPVVLDNDFINWHNFANHYWPAKYLFDQNGYLFYEHYGEGKYTETEQKIQELLRKDFGEKGLPPIKAAAEETGGFCTIPSPELYCGYIRGRLANRAGYHEDHLGFYDIDENDLPMDQIALKGNFDARGEYVESFDGSSLLVNFRGTEVNLVMEPSFGDLAAIGLEFNGQPVQKEIAGADVDQSDVIVSESRLYNLLTSNQPITGILKIKAKKSNFRAYAFTFSGCTS